MNDAFACVLSFVVGGLIGAIFFGGLWWTVRRGMASSRPALWFSISLLLRTTLVLAGFYFVALSGWQRLLVSLGGFLFGRILVTRFVKSPGKEISHAP